MRQFYKKAVFLLLLSLAGSHPVFSENNFKPFPEDTVQKFIKNYGKDSLVHLLDIRIAGAKKWIDSGYAELIDETVQSELALVSGQFKLGLDTLQYVNKPSTYFFNSLYGKYYGNSKYFQEIFENSKKGGDYDINKEIRGSLSSPDARMVLTGFCQYFQIDNAIVDSLTEKTVNASAAEKIKAYIRFAELHRKCGEKNILLENGKNKLFEEIYQKYNIENRLDRKDYFTDAKVYEFLLQYPLQILAYGLYGNNITLNANGKELMYLLKIQDDDYGWKMYHAAYLHAEIIPTVYGLWAMCEFRDQLKKGGK